MIRRSYSRTEADLLFSSIGFFDQALFDVDWKRFFRKVDFYCFCQSSPY